MKTLMRRAFRTEPSSNGSDAPDGHAGSSGGAPHHHRHHHHHSSSSAPPGQNGRGSSKHSLSSTHTEGSFHPSLAASKEVYGKGAYVHPLSPLGLTGLPKDAVVLGPHDNFLGTPLASGSPVVQLNGSPSSVGASPLEGKREKGEKKGKRVKKGGKPRGLLASVSSLGSVDLQPASPCRSRSIGATGECGGPMYDAQYGVNRGCVSRNRNRIGMLGDDDDSPSVRIYMQCIESSDSCTLRRLCWSGCPPRLRARCWQSLYSYSAQDRRPKYAQYIQHGSTLSNLSPSSHSVLKTICKDVPRTQQKLPLFRLDAMQASLQQVIFVWSVRNPATGYTQGMTDLATPFYIAFLSQHIPMRVLLSEENEKACREAVEGLAEDVLTDIEADVFWGFNAMVGSIQDHFTDGQLGIQRKLQALDQLLEEVEPKLKQHFDAANLSLMEFAFKWMSCLLVRELPLPLVLRLWDAYLSEGTDLYPALHVYVCLAVLCRYSHDLQQMDFCDMMQFLITPPTSAYTESDVSELLSCAYQLQQLYPVDL